MTIPPRTWTTARRWMSGHHLGLHLLACVALAASLTAADHSDDVGTTPMASGGQAEPPLPVADRPLSGTIGGVPWAAATCERFGDQSIPEVVHGRITPSRPAGGGPATPPALSIYLPKKAGTYLLAGTTYVNFPGPAGRLGAVKGQLVIYRATDTTIVFGLHARVDKDNDVSGKWTLELPPSAPAPPKP